ncbi:MAG: hypothetical protein GY953_47665 [bacterium]|nr:hypothetical protein [bacterium]
MKLGAEPWKVAVLGGLVLVAGYVIFSDSSTDVPTQTRPSTTPRAGVSPIVIPSTAPRQVTRRAPGRNQPRRIAQSFRPSLKPKRPEDRPDPMKVDPTLRLDLLAKLREVEANGVRRSLFDFGAPPKPKAPEPKILPGVDQKITEAQKKAAAERAERKKNAKKPPPPINLKFYGFIRPASTTDRRAFFLEGDNIYVASEGDLIEKRYKVIRIGLSSAVVEDTEHDHKQTLALVEELKG